MFLANGTSSAEKVNLKQGYSKNCLGQTLCTVIGEITYTSYS